MKSGNRIIQRQFIPPTPQINLIKGEQGEQGLQGERGERGEQGLQGDKGDKGDKGERGLQGERGERGLSGVNCDCYLQPKSSIKSKPKIYYKRVVLDYPDYSVLKRVAPNGTTLTYLKINKHP